MTEPPPPRGIVKPSDAELERLGIVWVDLAGVTPSGLPYPASSDPVANGAANIQALAEAVSAKYLLNPALGPAPATTFNPAGALPAGAVLQVRGGQMNITTDAAGQSVLYTGLPVGIMAISIMSTVLPSSPEDLTFSVAPRAGGTNNSCYVYVMKGGVKAASRAVGVTWMAIGW